MKYVYPAIFIQSDDGINIKFPDFENCYTSATNLIESIEMAKDVLCLTLYDLEELHQSIPTSSNIQDISTNKDDFVSYIECDTNAYRRMYDNKAVKKTLTIPSWLNDVAIENNINFSQLLKDAIIQQLELN